MATKDVAAKKNTPANSRASEQLPTEIINASAWDEDALRSITSFDEAVRLATTAYGDVETASDVLGDGFALLNSEDKGLLVGRPMLLMEWGFYDGDYGSKFVGIRAVVQNRDGSMGKYIFNDGSTGILEQLAKYTLKTGRTGGLSVKNGLRVSEYDYTDEETGKTRKAQTYYLDTAI